MEKAEFFFHQGIKNILSYIKDGFLDLCFPRLCLHCHQSDLEKDRILCEACSSCLEMIDKESRCSVCFSPKEKEMRCVFCYRISQPFVRFGAVFDYTGPAATLVKQFKYGKLDYLAQSMGAFIAAQLIALDWPLPDCIVPVPLTAMHFLSRGFNQTELLAKSVGHILDRPVCNALGRYSGEYSQAGLKKEQRLGLTSQSIVLLPRVDLTNQRVLLLDDVYTTGQTLRRCAEVLQQAHPKELYGITFCKAND